MIAIKSLHELPSPTGLVIGNFDGVHLGHQEVLKETRESCQSRGLDFGVLTFVPHPKYVLSPGQKHHLLCSYQTRRRLLEECKVDYLVELEFNRDLSLLSPSEFLKAHVDVAHLKMLFLGHDFAFGANKSGGHDVVTDYFEGREVNVIHLEKFQSEGIRVSSSIVRDLLRGGDVSESKKLLGRPHTMMGTVRKGEGRGRKIGFPTANIAVAQEVVCPKPGVYVTKTRMDQLSYQSITNVGLNPTFGDLDEVRVETHIFDFDHDIYGETIEVEFFERIRDEQKFESVNDLVAQIRLDVENARKYF